MNSNYCNGRPPTSLQENRMIMHVSSSDPDRGKYFDIYSDILSEPPFNIFSYGLSHVLSDIYSDILSGTLFDTFSEIVSDTYVLTCYSK